MRLMPLLLLLAATTAHAEVYKCTVAGAVTYTDKPCEANAEPADLPPLHAVPGKKSGDLAKQFDERIEKGRSARDKADAVFVKQQAQKTAREKAVRKAIIDHEVIEGMTPSEVQSALGHADETLPDGRWRYRRDRERITVRFKDGRVSGVSRTSGSKK